MKIKCNVELLTPHEEDTDIYQHLPKMTGKEYMAQIYTTATFTRRVLYITCGVIGILHIGMLVSTF